MTKKFRFSISTRYIHSEDWEEIELQFDDDESEEEIERQVNERYSEWLGSKNQGGWHEIENSGQ